MNNTKAQKIILVILVVLGIGYGVYEYYLASSNEKIIELTETLKQKKEKVRDLETFSRKRAEAERIIQGYESELKDLDQILPTKKDNSNFTTEIYDLIKENKIKADNVDLSYPPANNKYEVTQLAIQTSGSYEQIKQTIDALNKLKSKVSIKDFTIQATPENYSASIKVELYSLKE